MGTDPNSLLSSVIQSTATLVAIVGGFLFSRMIAIRSERTAAFLRYQRAQELVGTLRAPRDDPELIDTPSHAQDLREAERELRETRSSLALLVSPRHLRDISTAWTYLAVMAVSGLLFPVVVMSFDFRVTHLVKLVTGGLFTGSLGLLLGVFVKLARGMSAEATQQLLETSGVVGQ